MKEQGLSYKVITLTAKEKICFCEKTECNPDACIYAKGHFDRVNDAVFDMLTHVDDMSRDQIEHMPESIRSVLLRWRWISGLDGCGDLRL